MQWQKPHSQTRNSQRRHTEDNRSPRKLKTPHSHIRENEYFLGIQRYNFALPHPTPYMDRPEARGSARNLTESKNTPITHSNRIFFRNSLLQLRVAVPDPLHGQTGSPRKLKNIPIPRRNRIFSVDSALRLWAAAPGPLTWTDRKPAGAH